MTVKKDSYSKHTYLLNDNLQVVTFIIYTLMWPLKLSVLLSQTDMSISIKGTWARQTKYVLNKKVCMDATFALKLALQSRKEFGLDTCVVFVGVVKAFDTVNQDMLMKISHATESPIL